MTTLFRNVRIVTPSGVEPGEALVDGGRIAAVEPPGVLPQAADTVIDGGGDYLAPGFIDVHTHGAGGADFMDGDHDAVYTACRTHLRHGTTTLTPTTTASTRESLLSTVELFNGVELTRRGCPEILGLHLEGPYFAGSQRGAQDPAHLRNPHPDEYGEVFRRTDRVVRWSFAVELPGARDFLRALRERGIVASLAHSDATCRETMRACDEGVRALTHFYSGMAGVRRVDAVRVAGAIEAGYLLDGLYVEVIADGMHLPEELLRLIHKVKGADRICLVTDSMRAAGMPEGRYRLGSREGGVECFVEDGVAKLMDRSAFAGSVATADRLVRTMRDLARVPLHEAVAMMTMTPARLMGVDGRKGSVAPGKDADLVLFDEAVAVRTVMARGELISFEENE